MTVNAKNINARGLRFAIEQDGLEVAHAYLYLMTNDLHGTPFGLMEDVFVDESQRGLGIGTELVEAVIGAAKEERCYKLIAMSRDSRPTIDELFRRRGFSERGKEFRMDF